MTTQTLSYTCPHCGTPVDVIPETGQELVACPAPHCGKPFKIEVPVAERAADLVLPSAANEPERKPVLPLAQSAAAHEEEVCKVRLHALRRYPFRCLGYLVIIAVGVAFAFWLRDWWFAVLAGLAVASIALFRLLLWTLRMRLTTLTLTTKRCILESGVFAKQSTEVLLQDITEIHVGQSLLARLLGAGDLVILSNNGEKKLVVMAVRDPVALAARIQSGRPAVRAGGRNGDATLLA
jgi:uncharacterized membrane protein YdbT with pleckstrin-like domain